jgi:8-oxo-dGTP diphosphatase
VIFLVRHAHAGDKARHGSDERRPLSPGGRAEAAGLVSVLAPYPLTRIITGPADRCRQTVSRIAREHAVPLTVDPRLGREARVYDTLRLISEAGHEGIALCTHGELIGALLFQLRAAGGPVPRNAGWAKGSVWALEFTAQRLTAARYLPPVPVHSYAA